MSDRCYDIYATSLITADSPPPAPNIRSEGGARGALLDAYGASTVEYDWLTEQGQIVTGHIGYDVRKHGVFSGHWTLERAGEVVADARKPSAMFRSFEITGTGVEFTVRAVSAMTRVFEIGMSEQVVGRVSPVHAFTRRATISCSDAIPQHLQLFAFWLVGLTWRRAASKNSGAAS